MHTTSSPQIFILHHEFEDILHQSFRYCLGRKTYVVENCVRRLTHHWPSLSSEFKRSVQREIKRAIKFDLAGHELNIAEWKKILKLKIER